MKEYKSFYKTVGGNEGDKCHYDTRLDTYGCGCQHNCNFCYSKSLLAFRGLWNATEPSVADIEKIKRKINNLPVGMPPLRLGGMTDCFQPIEERYKVTYETIKALNDRGIQYLIVTKSNLVARDDYLEVLDKDLAHIQISVTYTDDGFHGTNEHASLPSERIRAIETLYKNGYDVSVRLSPYIPEFVDIDIINNIDCDKILVEFLRVNTWIKKWLDLDYSEYTVKQSGYYHLPLEKKIELLSKINGFKEISVCEDETEAYEYWKKNVNANPDDCCNLRR